MLFRSRWELRGCPHIHALFVKVPFCTALNIAQRAGVLRAHITHLAYRFCLEDSIYLAESARGQGIGRLLLAELLARCEAAGARQMLAVIGDSANAGSIGVHAALGFAHSGVLKASGWKFDRWLDVVLMQRALGSGDQTPAQG